MKTNYARFASMLAAVCLLQVACQSSTVESTPATGPAPYGGISADQVGKPNSQWEMQKWQYEQTKKLRGY